MSKKYFAENISDETLAKLIDKTLNFEKNKSNENKMKINFIKLIPAVAAIAIVVGFFNILPRFMNPETDIEQPDNFSATNESLFVSSDEEIPLFLPTVVEKSFFEDKILACITNQSDLNKMNAYYMLKDPSAPELSDSEREKMIEAYPICKIVPIYVLGTTNITERERNILLDFIIKYTDIKTGNDIVNMYVANGIAYKNLIDRYTHVRFGQTRDTLLVEVEWHTYETWLDWVDEYKNVIEYHNKKTYFSLSDKANEKYDSIVEQNVEYYRGELAELIKESKIFVSRTVNGKPYTGISFAGDGNESIDDILYSNNKYNPDGYYMFSVYPYLVTFGYFDENDEHQQPWFEIVNSKAEFDKQLENEIIPLCDDLLARGLITREYYDTVTRNPLDIYVDMFFN